MRLEWYTKGYLLATKKHHNKTSNAIKKINKNFLQNAHFLPPILESETAKKQEIRPIFSV